jgi:type IV pilus assembly protein PilZ
MRENRQDHRSAAIIKVNYSSHGALKMDYAQNISRGGLFLATNSAFEMGQDIELHLRSQGESRPIPVPGKVRWIGERGTPPVQGIGVQFTLDDPTVRDHVESMIKALEAPQNILEDRAAGEILIYLLDPNEFASKMYAEGIEKMAKYEGEELEGPIRVKRMKTTEQLMQALGEEVCAVLITELKATDLDGVKLIRMLYATYGDALPVFAISRPFAQDRFMALEAGAVAFLNKPLQMRTLFNTLLICLDD